MMLLRKCVGVLCILQLFVHRCVSLSAADKSHSQTLLQPRDGNNIIMNRRDWTNSVAAMVGGATSLSLITTCPIAAEAATMGSGGLASKLAQRDPNVLTNSVFNIPPGPHIYPDFMRGTWDMHCRFGGFLFPSTNISKQRLTQNFLIPGFQKCSIAAISDVGKEDIDYQMAIDVTTGLEDRIGTLTSQINANLGYAAVNEILYDPKSNPNRLSIIFDEYKTKNAERIELFCNGRDSEMVKETGVFVCSEYIRQVTFGTGSQVGVPRQVVGNYAHFWTWRETREDPSRISGNLLTAAYLDPQDAMFFEEPSKPVAVYSHVLTGVRRAS